MTVNDCSLEGKERFGDAVGAVLVKMDVFFKRIVASSGKDFNAWLAIEGLNLASVLIDYPV